MLILLQLQLIIINVNTIPLPKPFQVLNNPNTHIIKCKLLTFNSLIILPVIIIIYVNLTD